jgi:hypothetical protein
MIDFIKNLLETKSFHFQIWKQFHAYMLTLYKTYVNCQNRQIHKINIEKKKRIKNNQTNLLIPQILAFIFNSNQRFSTLIAISCVR